MITFTDNAAEEIKLSVHNPETQGLLLRFAVEKTADGWQYMMGFDNLKSGSDTHLESNGIEYIVAYEQRELLDGTTVDFDEFDKEAGYGFIFLNPNDPDFSQPTEK